MDLLRGRRLRRITQAVYDGAAAQRGDGVERHESRWLPGPFTVLALVLVLLAVTAGSLWHLLHAPEPVAVNSGAASSHQSGALADDAADSGAVSGATEVEVGPTASVQPPASVVIVYVTGRVSQPGIVKLPEGSRVVDALERAGGTTQGADLDALNLARVVTDGEHLVVWAQGEAPEEAGTATGLSGATGAGGAQTCVDLATADEQALQALDGVGPALAGRIVTYREQVGTISSVEQLDEVPGIGTTLVQRIAAGVCP